MTYNQFIQVSDTDQVLVLYINENDQIYLEVHPRGEDDIYYTGFTTLSVEDAEVLCNELSKMIEIIKQKTPVNNRG